MTTFNAGTIEATMDLDVDPFQQGVRLVREEGRRLGSEKYKVTIDADTGRATSQLTMLRTLLGDITGRHVVRVDVQGYGAANAQILRLTSALDRLERTYVPRVDLDTVAAMTQLELIDQRLDALERDDVDVRVDVDTSGAVAGIGGVSSRLGALVALAAGLAPALVPALAGLGAVSGGLVSALGVAGGGLGAFGVAAVGQVMEYAKAAKVVTTLSKQLSGLEKGTKEYRETAKALADQQSYVNEQFGVFADAMSGLLGAWEDFLAATRVETLDALAAGLESVAGFLPYLVDPANAVAKAVGGMFDRFDAWLQGGAGDAMSKFLTETAPGMIGSLLDVLGAFGRFLGGIIVAFEPFARIMLDGLADVIDGWAEWAAGFPESNAFGDFIDFVVEFGPLFLDVMGSLWAALVQIGRALAPLAGPALLALRGLFDTIAGMDPTTLAVVVGIAGALAAFTFAPIAGGVIAIVGLAAALKGLYDQSEGLQRTFAPFVDMFPRIAADVSELANVALDGLREAWDNVQPALKRLGKLIRTELAPAFSDFWDAAQPMLHGLAYTVGPAAEVVIRSLILAVEGLVHVMVGTLEFLTGVFTGDWSRAWEGIKRMFVGQWDIIRAIPRAVLTTFRKQFADANKWLSDLWMTMWAAIRAITTASGEWLANALWRGDDSILGKVKGGFRSAVDGIRSIWAGLREAAAAPVRFIIDTVYNNGIRKLVNAIPGIPGELGPISMGGSPGEATGPSMYTGKARGLAAGGSVTGGVPRTDSVPAWLMPGEHVWTVDEVAALGGQEAMYRLRAMVRNNRESVGQRFAGGGTVQPLAGAHAGTYPGHDGVDLNVGSGWDDYGMPVRAFRDGTISYVGSGRGYGTAVFQRGPYGEVVYGHLSRTSVSTGQGVSVGQVIGAVGNTGNSSHPHLHFGYPGGSYASAMALLAGAVSGGAGVGFAGSGKMTVEDRKQNVLARFGGAITAAADFAKSVPGWIGQLSGMGGWGPDLVGLLKHVGRGAAGWVNDKIPNRFLPDNPIPLGIFDQGGMLQPGGMAVNLGKTPERVLTDDQWRAMSGAAAGRGGGLSSAAVDKIVEAIESNRAIQVQGAPETSVGELVDRINFELRR